MPVRLSQIMDRVTASEPSADRSQLERTVRETIAALGMHVGRDGEVCDPRPAPAPYPEDNSRRLYGRRRYR